MRSLRICRMSSSLIRKAALFVCGVLAVQTVAAGADALATWKLTERLPDRIRFARDGASLTVAVDAEAKKHFSAAKAYAQALMDSLHGGDLRPLPAVRGWEFSFAGTLGCALAVADNGDHYKVTILCGAAPREELAELLAIAERELAKKQ